MPSPDDDPLARHGSTTPQFNRAAEGQEPQKPLGPHEQRGSEQVKNSAPKLELRPPGGAVRSNHNAAMKRDDAAAKKENQARALALSEIVNKTMRQGAAQSPAQSHGHGH